MNGKYFDFKKAAKALLAVAVSAALLTAAAHAHDRYGAKGKHMMALFKQLNLSADQLATVRSVMLSTRDAMLPMKEDISKMRGELFSLMASGNNDEASFLALTEQYKGTFKHMIQMMADSKFAIYNTLDDEQKRKAEAMIQRKADRMASRDPMVKFERIADRLDLSQQQKIEIQALMPDMLSARDDAMQIRKAFQQSLRQSFKDGSYSQETVNILFEQHFSEFSGALYQVLVQFQKAFAVLDEEQREAIMNKSRFMHGIV